MIGDADRRRLDRWQRRMVTLFVGTWVYVLILVAVDVLTDAPPRAVGWALVPAVALVILGGWLQFSIRCPACGYRLGRQSRLVVPEHCRACGVSLRRR